jgi:DNA polymerase (family 10)
VEIKADGSQDYPDEVLAGLDVVIASLHTGLRQPREKVTARALKAIRNPHVDILGHPTGRLYPDREGADLDMDAVLAAAADTRTALEINSHPSRLDLNDQLARRARDMGIVLAINTDAHAEENFDVLFYGIATARRAWLKKEDVLNTWPVEKIIGWLKERRS